MYKFKKNPDLWQRFFLREQIIRTIRNFFYKEKFHEVETPILLPALIPESYLDVFETFLKDRHGNKKRMFLATSPEASIKKLIAAGLGNCFEITKSFRNGETGSIAHNPEFTILEWYRIKASYKDIMSDCENLILFLYKNLKSQISAFQINKLNHKSLSSVLKMTDFEIVYQKQKINLAPPWEKLSVVDALKKYADIDFDDITEKKKSDLFPAEKLAKVAERKGYNVNKNNSWEEIFNQIFLNEIEPHLGTHGKPTFIYDYPKPMAGLAKIKENEPRLAERFELYIAGLELGDCYNELTDYNEQKARFQNEFILIKKKKKTKVIADNNFLQALKTGLPPCSGIALGVDRLVMLFTDSYSIKDVLLFPLD